jgi:hypothetical protein
LVAIRNVLAGFERAGQRPRLPPDPTDMAREGPSAPQLDWRGEVYWFGRWYAMPHRLSLMAEIARQFEDDECPLRLLEVAVRRLPARYRLGEGWRPTRKSKPNGLVVATNRRLVLAWQHEVPIESRPAVLAFDYDNVAIEARRIWLFWGNLNKALRLIGLGFWPELRVSTPEAVFVLTGMSRKAARALLGDLPTQLQPW